MAALSGLAGCGPSGPDFTEPAKVPAAMLVDEFAALASLSSPLTEAGYGSSRVRVERRGKSELLFTIPSSESKDGSTFLLQFTPGQQPLHSEVKVTIEVPALPMGVNKVLSEQKVEDYFQRHTKALIAAMASRESTSAAAHEFVSMFDALALATNPSLKRKLENDVRTIDLEDGEDTATADEPSDEEVNRGMIDDSETDRGDEQLGTEPQGAEPDPREPEGTDPNPD